MKNHACGTDAKAGPFAPAYNVPAASQLLDQCPQRAGGEFTHLRYSAVTCNPDFFKDSGFNLRQALYHPPRQTELFIAVTMYNEDEVFLCRTLQGIMENVSHLCSSERDKFKSWGMDGWKGVVVCIIGDGRRVINSRSLSVLTAMGLYSEDIAKFGEKDVMAHVFEYTTQICMTPSRQLLGTKEGVVPVQFIFCLKEKNQKKINSHRWFFNAFAPILQPNVCVLIDVGTQPGPKSIYHLWKAFEMKRNLGGACGELVVLKHGTKLLNPLVAAQNFEYKLSNTLDKPFESVTGYISVLPGAFSAYRYAAIKDDCEGSGPLKKYFSGEKTMQGASDTYTDVFTANMYLAEDRILGWELVSRPDTAWVLGYVKSAWAVTDVPEQVPELISQRRRWLNGAFFVALHSTVHFYRLWNTSHAVMQKIRLHIGILYQAYNLIFSWFGLAHYYIAFILLSSSLEDPSLNLKGIKFFNIVLIDLFLALVFVCFVASLATRPQGSQWVYTVAIIGFAVVTLHLTVIGGFLTVKALQHAIAFYTAKSGQHISASVILADATFRNFVLSIPMTFGIYVLASLVFLDPWHMVTSCLQALLFAPSNVAVLNLYAFANMHDVSWGTKGDNKVKTYVCDAEELPSTEERIGRREFKHRDSMTEKESVHLTLDMDNIQEMVEYDIKRVSIGEVEISFARNVNASYENAIRLLNAAKAQGELETKEERATAHEDYYRGFRLNLLLAWGFTNAFMAAAILWSPKRGSSMIVNIYMSVMLYTVTGQAFIRFLGTVMYQVSRLWGGL